MNDVRPPDSPADLPDLTCRCVADFLMSYLEGELPKPVQKAFESHLSLCPSCVAYVESYKRTVELARRAHLDPERTLSCVAPDSLVQAILAARKTPPDAKPQ